MKYCHHSTENAVKMQKALMQRHLPGPRHILTGFFVAPVRTAGMKKTDWRYWFGKAMLYRAVGALAILFIARAWAYDEPYIVALGWTLTAALAFELLGAMITGWLLEIGGELCACEPFKGD